MQKTEGKISIEKSKVLKSLVDTEKFAQDIADQLQGGEVIGLIGSLGAGKTTFTQALARALGIKKNLRSPSFTVLQVYTIPDKKRPTVKRRQLCHVDVYRVTNTEELEALGLFDHMNNPQTITVIEWADNIKDLLPNKAQFLTFILKNNIRTVTRTTH